MGIFSEIEGSLPRRVDNAVDVVATLDRQDSSWHTVSVEGVLERLKSSLSGLSSREAAQRIILYGANELQASGHASPWGILFGQLKNVLIIILLVATAVSVFLGHGLEAAAIAFIVLFAVLLGFIQEYRAERAIEALREMTAPTATIVRNGIESEIPARDLVPGDLILLITGDKVPADARLIEAVNLQIEEAALTGESIPVEKQTSALCNKRLAIGDQNNMAFTGTVVTYGRGRAVVVATGSFTEFGKIAGMLEAVERGKTPLQKNLDKVGNSLARIALVVVAVSYELQGSFSRNGSIIEPAEPLLSLLRAGTLASDAHIVCKEASDGWQVKGDPTEGALIVAAAKAGLGKAELDSEFPRIDEIPFTSEAKRMTTLHKTTTGVIAYSKGAPEVILNSCNRQLSENGEGPLSDESKREILEVAQQMAGEALRVLAVAFKPGARLGAAERDMIFLGLVGMFDPPRQEARTAIRKCQEAGIKVVMITGDHPATAKAVARELGLLKTGHVVTGLELEAISEETFRRDVERIDVYARVSPAHKLRVVTALQENGHVAAMTGDGINDAPALKKADLGIAMGITGTDVTKEAAAMTLTDDNFASIVAAVEEGRGIFSNIKKYLMYLLSSNIGEIGLMAGTSLLGLPLPLSAVQILYVNLATDGLPALALAFDPPESDLMRRPPRDPHVGIFTHPVVMLMTIGGLWSTGVNLGLFIWARNSGRSLSEAMTMTFVSLVLIQFFKAYNFRSDRHSVFSQPFANTWLNLAILWELFMLVLILYLPLFHKMFQTFSLPPTDWLIILGVTFTISPVLELAKWMERREWFGEM